MARIDPQKGQHVLVEAAGRLRGGAAPVHLVLVGHPTRPDYLKGLRAQAARAGFAERLHVVHEEMRSIAPERPGGTGQERGQHRGVEDGPARSCPCPCPCPCPISHPRGPYIVTLEGDHWPGRHRERFPEECIDEAKARARESAAQRGQGGGGGNCDAHLNSVDGPVFRALGQRDPMRAARCWASANQRYAECLRGGGPHAIRTPLDTWNN